MMSQIRISIPPLKSGKAFWVFITSVGIALALHTFSIQQSDVAALPKPVDNPFLFSLLNPLFCLVIPSLFLWLVFLAVRLVSARAATGLAYVVMSVAIALWTLRLYFLATGSLVESVAVPVAVFLVALGLIVLWPRFVVTAFAYGSLGIIAAAVFFVYSVVSAASPVPLKDARPGTTAIRAERPGKPIPVFILLVDELSSFILRDGQGRIDPRAFPHLSRLAGQATWYVNSTTGESNTTLTIKSMLAGLDLFKRYKGLAMTTSPDLPNVFAYLSSRRKISIWESHNNLVATEKKLRRKQGPLTRRLVSYLQRLLVAYSWGVFHPRWLRTIKALLIGGDYAFRQQVGQVRSSLARFQNFLDSINDDVNRCYFYYSYLPHHPYMVNPGGSFIVIYPRIEVKRPGGRVVVYPHYSDRHFDPRSRTDRGQTSQNIYRSYVNQVRFTDGLIGRFVDTLRKKGVFDRALIIICSDHGTGFTGRAPGRKNRTSRDRRARFANDMMNAASVLIIKYPFQKQGRIDRRPARPYDVAPTILNVLGLAKPWPMEGLSLLAKKWPARKIMFRPGAYDDRDRFVYLPRVRLSPPADYRVKTDVAASYPRAPLLGRRVADLQVTGRDKGGPRFVTLESPLPGRNRGRWIMTLSGYSPYKSRVPDLVYVALNGKLVAAVRPSQYRQREGTLPAGWAVAMPPSGLKAGLNTVRVLIPVGTSSTGVVAAGRPLSFRLTGRQIRLLSGTVR